LYSFTFGIYLNILTDYVEDSTFVILSTILLFTTIYNMLAVKSLWKTFMYIIMILIGILLVLWFPCIIFCLKCMSWNPQNDGDGDVDRTAFEMMIHNRTNFQDTLLYIFKQKRKKFIKVIVANKPANTVCSKAEGERWNIPTEKSEDNANLSLNIQNNLDTIRSKNDRQIHPIQSIINLETKIDKRLIEDSKGEDWNNSKLKEMRQDLKISKKLPQIQEEELWVVWQDYFKNGCSIIELDCDLATKEDRDCKIGIIKNTKHTFHWDCLQKWLKVKFSCPTWRADLLQIYKSKISIKAIHKLDEDPNVMYAEDIRKHMNRIKAIFREIENDQEEPLNNDEDFREPNSITILNNTNILREIENVEVIDDSNRDSLPNEDEIEIQPSRNRNRNQRNATIEDDNSDLYLRQGYNNNIEEGL